MALWGSISVVGFGGSIGGGSRIALAALGWWSLGLRGDSARSLWRYRSRPGSTVSDRHITRIGLVMAPNHPAMTRTIRLRCAIN